MMEAKMAFLLLFMILANTTLCHNATILLFDFSGSHMRTVKAHEKFYSSVLATELHEAFKKSECVGFITFGEVPKLIAFSHVRQNCSFFDTQCLKKKKRQNRKFFYYVKHILFSQEYSYQKWTNVTCSIEYATQRIPAQHMTLVLWSDLEENLAEPLCTLPNRKKIGLKVYLTIHTKRKTNILRTERKTVKKWLSAFKKMNLCKVNFYSMRDLTHIGGYANGACD